MHTPIAVTPGDFVEAIDDLTPSPQKNSTTVSEPPSTGPA